MKLESFCSKTDLIPLMVKHKFVVVISVVIMCLCSGAIPFLSYMCAGAIQSGSTIFLIFSILLCIFDCIVAAYLYIMIILFGLGYGINNCYYFLELGYNNIIKNKELQND